MAIPAFTKFGLLPDGCFPVTVEEITQRYLHIPNRKIIWNNFLLVFIFQVCEDSLYFS